MLGNQVIIRALVDVARAAQEHVALWTSTMDSKDYNESAVMVAPFCNEDMFPKHLRESLMRESPKRLDEVEL